MSEIDSLRKEGQLIDTGTHARELAIFSLAKKARIFEILQSFGCFALSIDFTEKTQEKSLVEAYKDFNGLFEDHFYKKASIGAEKIKEEKLSTHRNYESNLVKLEISRELFLVTSQQDMEESFEFSSRQLLEKAVEHLKPKLTKPPLAQAN
jgi:hypothetical protein